MQARGPHFSTHLGSGCEHMYRSAVPARAFPAFRRFFSGSVRRCNDGTTPATSTFRILADDAAAVPGTPDRFHESMPFKRVERANGLNRVHITLHDYFGGNKNQTHKVFRNENKYKQGRNVEQRTFVDLKLVQAVSGRGGNGSVSFFRDAHRPVGPADGGDGGRGGDVYVHVVEGLTSLHKVKKTYVAQNGGAGTGRQLDGRKGDDVVIEVPAGTTVRWIPDPRILRRYLQDSGHQLDSITLEFHTTDNDSIQWFRDSYAPGEGWLFKERDEEYHRQRQYFTDLDHQVQAMEMEMQYEELCQDQFPVVGIDFNEPTEAPVLLMRGGGGGMGNMHFLTKDIRNPRFSKRGREGLREFFILELKIIADLGLVGLPNAGKSTLLRAISRARPRVGHWEFTTLQPTVGTIFTTIDRDPFTVADIPGIIKGASHDKGMGLDFLRHIERSKGLVFVVSLESKSPSDDLDILVQEVGEKRMEGKRVLVVATKADVNSTPHRYRQLQKYVENNGWKILPVSAQNGENVERCIEMMAETAGR